MSGPAVTVELSGLQTEKRNARSTDIDQVSTLELCRIFNREDKTVPTAVESCIAIIAEVIDALTERVRQGGRVFYIGAGTSGRLGVLDASEIPPTYSAPGDQFVAMIAGGDVALRHAREGAEDSREAAEADLKLHKFDPDVDSLVGIASSGRTPYVLGGLSFARSVGGTTVGLVCVSPSAVGDEGNADYLITAVTGPEVVTGSTRMKAGTATKLVLNMISTGIMIKLGKTYGNLMIDMKATNLKLQQRAKNILRSVCGSSCTQSDQQLEQILDACHGSVKLAAATIVLGVPVAEAKQRLERNLGVLSSVFHEGRERAAPVEVGDEGLVLCVDAGGTSCKAVIMARDGAMGTGEAGPCNLTNAGVENSLATMAEAIQMAADTCIATRGRSFHSIRFSAVWVGMAGYDRPALTQLVRSALSGMIKLAAGAFLRVTADIDVLPAVVTRHASVDCVIVLVAGTGSVAMSYARDTSGAFTRTGRIGGWGCLLGDDGSGFNIGREALRLALDEADAQRMLAGSGRMTLEASSPLFRALFNHFEEQCRGVAPADLHSAVLMPHPEQHRGEDATLATTKRIAGAARVVLAMAQSEAAARRIVDDAVNALARIVASLVKAKRAAPATTALVLAGGLMHDQGYRDGLLAAISRNSGPFKLVEMVGQPALAGARYLHSLLPTSPSCAR